MIASEENASEEIASEDITSEDIASEEIARKEINANTYFGDIFYCLYNKLILIIYEKPLS